MTHVETRWSQVVKNHEHLQNTYNGLWRVGNGPPAVAVAALSTEVGKQWAVL